MENNDKYVWNKGDIQIAKTQCEFCTYNDEKDTNKCSKYPDGKLLEVVNNLKACPKYKDKNDFFNDLGGN